MLKPLEEVTFLFNLFFEKLLLTDIMDGISKCREGVASEAPYLIDARELVIPSAGVPIFQCRK